MKHQPGNPGMAIEGQYLYDATNRMVKGVNRKGEESHYVYNGLGYLVANEWVIEKNAYGYTHNSSYMPPSEQVGGVVVCDRHTNSTGQGHINPTGKGHTTGGTTGGSHPSLGNRNCSGGIRKMYRTRRGGRPRPPVCVNIQKTGDRGRSPLHQIRYYLLFFHVAGYPL